MNGSFFRLRPALQVIEMAGFSRRNEKCSALWLPAFSNVAPFALHLVASAMSYRPETQALTGFPMALYE